MPGRLTKYLRPVVAMTALGVALFLLFWGAMVASHCVPYYALEKHLSSSAEQLAARYDEDYGEPPEHGLLYMPDRGTEVVMMQCVASTRPTAGHAAIRADSAAVSVSLRGVMGEPDALRDALEDESSVSEVYPYSRYWHGYLVLLRSWLVVTDYHIFTMVNILLLCAAMAWAVVAVGRRLSWGTAAWWGVVMLLSAPWTVGGCLQFLPCFMLMAVACAMVMTWPAITRTTLRAAMFFLTLGALTAYFDFLTTPVITLGFPAALLIIKDKNNPEMGSPLRRTLWLCIVWSVGYFGLWGAKWILAAAYGADIVADVAQAVSLRAGIATGFPKFDALMMPLTVVCIALIIATAVILYRNRTLSLRVKTLIIIALLPVVWTLIARNHTVVHYYFTWRSYLVTLFSVGCCLIETRQILNGSCVARTS